jgi:hypothetical protein
MTDLTISIPGLIIILVVISIFPGSLLGAMITFGILSAPGLGRLVRAAVLLCERSSTPTRQTSPDGPAVKFASRRAYTWLGDPV